MKSDSRRLPLKPLLFLMTGVCLGITLTLVILLLLRHNSSVTVEYHDDGKIEESGPSFPHRDDLSVNTSPEAASLALLRVVDQIEGVFEQVPRVERLAALYKIVGQLNNRNLKDLLTHLADLQWDVSSQNRMELQTALIERLVSTNPEDAIEFVVNQESEKSAITTSLISIIGDSSKSDSENAASEFIPMAEASRTLAYRAISKKHPHIPFKRKSEIATQLDLETDFIRLYLESLDASILKDAQLIGHADRDIVQDDFSDITHLIDSLTQWYDSRGVEVLDHMRTTLSKDDTEAIIASIVLKHVATTTPSRALEYVFTRLRTETQLLVTEEVVREWANQNPSEAFAAVSELDAGRMKTQLQYSVVYYWATKDPEYVLDNLSSFPPRTQIDGASNAIGSLGTYSPDRAVEWLRQMSDVNMLRAAANTLVSVWSRTDLNAVQKWVLEEPAIASIRTDLYEPLAYRMVASDPLGALELARKHPLATGQVGVEASIFREIAFQDLQAALKLLPNVRAGQKNFAYGAVGSVYVQNRDFQNAVDLGLQLDESAHANYYQYIAYIWVNTDAERLYEMLPELPSEEARSKAAYALCVLNDDNDYFTKAQVEVLDQYLTTEDRDTLGPLAPSNDP